MTSCFAVSVKEVDSDGGKDLCGFKTGALGINDPEIRAVAGSRAAGNFPMQSGENAADISHICGAGSLINLLDEMIVRMKLVKRIAAEFVKFRVILHGLSGGEGSELKLTAGSKSRPLHRLVETVRKLFQEIEAVGTQHVFH